MTPPRRVNGEPVSRAELGAHLERIDESIESLHTKMDDLAEYVRRPQHWLSARVTKIVDWGVIAGATGVIAYIAANA